MRAALCLGLVAGLWVTTSQAYWTDEAQVSGTTFTAGTLDLRINNADSVTSTALSMTAMVPGSTSTQMIVVKNAGTAPLKYTLSGGLTGTNASAFSSALSNGLTLTIRLNGTDDGTACSGGQVVFDQPLTNVPSTSILGKRPAGPLAPGSAESFCFQVKLGANAPSTLQGATANAVFTAAATSDVS